MERKAIILFTRVPMAGKTKTRLQPFLSGNECALLHEAFIKDIFAVMESTEADVIVCYTPEAGCAYLKSLICKARGYIPQRGCGLGDKMYNAISDVLNMGYDCCVLTGSDIPLLTKEDIEVAFDILKYKDMAVSPTEDGGYYLIGMKEPCPEVFSIKYEGGAVFNNTCAAIRRAGKSYGMGQLTLDIDNRYDLFRLANMLESDGSLLCTHTKKTLRYIFDKGGKNERIGCTANL